MSKAMKLSLFLLAAAPATAGARDVTALACVPSAGNKATDIITAKAAAKGSLVLELSSRVTAERRLESVTTETGDSLEQADHLTENVTVTGSRQLGRVRVTESGYREINHIQHYCIRLAI